MIKDPLPSDDTFAALIRAGTSLARKTKFLTLSTIVVGAVAALVILLLPQRYTSTATVLVSKNASQANGSPLAALKESGLGSLLGGINSGGSELPDLKTLLQTRQLALWAVRKYRLDSVWSDGRSARKPMSVEDQVKNWQANLDWAETEYSDGLDLSFKSPTPELCRQVVQGTLFWLDSSYRALAKENAQVREEYLNVRLKAQLRVVDSLQDTLAAYQVKNRIVSPAAQIEGLARGAADLEIEAEKLDLEIRTLQRSLGGDNSSIQQLRVSRDQTREAAERLLRRDGKGSILKGMASGVEALLVVQRIQRQIQVQAAVYSYLLQQREQISLDLSKDLPSLSVVDPPLVPKKRTSPPRRLLLQTILVLWVLGAGSTIVILDVLRRSPPNPRIQEAWDEFLASLPFGAGRLLR